MYSVSLYILVANYDTGYNWKDFLWFRVSYYFYEFPVGAGAEECVGWILYGQINWKRVKFWDTYKKSYLFLTSWIDVILSKCDLNFLM